MDDKQNLINSLKADYLKSSPDDIINYILSSGNFRRYRKITNNASEAIANVLVGAYGKDKAKEIVNKSKLTNKEEANKYIKENMNTKLIQLIHESINEYIREIDEAGNIAALEAKMNKTQEAIELREKKMNMDGIDEAYHDMIDKNKMKELSSEVKALKKSLTKYEKQLEKLKNKGKKSEEPKEETEKEIVDEVSIDETNIDETFPENGPGLEEEMGQQNFTYKDKMGKTRYVTADNIEQAKEKVIKFGADPNTIKGPQKEELNESYLKMQKLAGLITESEYKKKLKK